MEDHFHKNFYKELCDAVKKATTQEEVEMAEIQAANYALEYHKEIFGCDPEDLMGI